jgi:hypothetical protein
MEFLLGSIFTVLLLLTAFFVILKLNLIDQYAPKQIIFRQSYIHSLLTQKLEKIIAPQELPRTQSRQLLSKKEISVLFSGLHAYWIMENRLYQANIINGEIDDSTKKIVDTMTMNKVELDKIFFIVQKLTEGKTNDSGGSGVGKL